MSAQSRKAAKPFAQVKTDRPVNHDDSWRFRCPEFHTTLYWWSDETVACRSCLDNPAVNSESYSTYEIIDQVTGRPLAHFINGEVSDEQRR